MKNNLLEGDKVAELLKPRYKVIADYPDSKYKVDEIIELTWNDPLPNKYGGYQSFYNKYPHLFKKLQWWEERKEDKMPEYIKFIKDYMGYKKGQVFKTCPDWGKSEIENMVHFITDPKSEYGKAGVPAYFNQLMPATKQEFEDYLNQQGK